MDDDLGTCLRAWRDRIAPADAGLPSGGRRRAPGLRRQEVAELAGVSVEYLARLEQGRASRPSAGVIGPLARALRLSDAERDHLLVLAGHAPEGAQVAAHVSPSVQRIVDRLGDVPIHGHDDTFDIVFANPLSRALLGEDYFAGKPNLARTMFLGGPMPVRDADGHHDRFRNHIVADLRTNLASSPMRERVRALVDELLEVPRFAELWARGDVLGVHEHRKTIDHPEVGPVTVDCDVLRVDGSSLRLIVYTAPPGSPDAQALALLAAIGTQSFAA